MNCICKELGFDIERTPVWVATFYSDSCNKVGNRLFSTEEKALAYKECLGRMSKKFIVSGTVKITKRYIDETREEMEDRCGRKLSRK